MGVEGVDLAIRLTEDDALATGEGVAEVDAAGGPFLEGGAPLDENTGPGKESEELLKHGDMVTT